MGAIDKLGDFVLFLQGTSRATLRIWKRRGLFLRHCEFIGVSSTGIITVSALFMGGVLGYQLYVSFHYFGAEALLGGTVGVALFRELGPVMAGVMVTGRAGAAMAAELASMRVSEQIDALEVMGVDPMEYLVAPRVLASAVTMPILSAYFAVVGSYASYGVACYIMDLDPTIYWEQYKSYVDTVDISHCLVKGFAFGLVLAVSGCFYGSKAYGGARAVGAATRNTVVMSCLGILLVDYILTSLLPFGFHELIVE